MNEDIELNISRNDYSDLFEYIINSYEKRISRFIYHMIHDSDAVKDLTQDVFMKIYINLYKYDPKFPLEPWLYKIAYNLTLNYIKKNKKRILEVPFVEASEVRDTLEVSIENFETRQLILKEIYSLKPDYREIFLLKIMEDLSFEQIAEILNASVNSVKLKFYRNRKRIIEKISGYIKEGQI
jgi:RNA polymerase sigma-70 factor (ECF subfamily)